MKKVCADTNRPVNKVKDIFTPFSYTSEERYVLKQVLSKDSNAADIFSEDEKIKPGSLIIGDISSDGFPDIMITMKYQNGTSKTHILLNDPCQAQGEGACSPKAYKAKRRHFNLNRNHYQDILDGHENTKNSVFFDLNENSMLDVLLVKSTNPT